jgi:hypothetical protein
MATLLARLDMSTRKSMRDHRFFGVEDAIVDVGITLAATALPCLGTGNAEKQTILVLLCPWG